MLKLLHPFIPFVTEILWQIFTEKKLGPLMLSNFPSDIKTEACSQQTTGIDCVIDMIKAIRRRRKELNVPAGKILSEVFIEWDYPEYIGSSLIFIKRLARVTNIIIINGKSFNSEENEFNVVIAQRSKIYIKNNELFDKDEEIKKLNKELERTKDELEKIEEQLSNSDFLSKAPASVVDKVKTLKVNLINKMKMAEKSLHVLEK